MEWLGRGQGGESADGECGRRTMKIRHNWLRPAASSRPDGMSWCGIVELQVGEVHNLGQTLGEPKTASSL
jgi:hypothetical protein